MSDWREVEAIWQGELKFVGQDQKSNLLSMGNTEKVFSPMELILLGLAGCTGIDVALILEKKRQTLSGLKVRVRGLRRDVAPRTYTEIAIEYIFWGDKIDEKVVEQAVSLSQEKYYSVSAMLRESCQLVSSIIIFPTAPKET
jgi:putative redox protein